MKVCVIGLGEIGWETFQEISKDKSLDMYGVEISDERIHELTKNKPYLFSKKISKNIIKDADVYILSVYTPKQIKDVLSKINLERKPLVVIESTMLPGETKLILQEYPGIDLVLFPHRYNPNDAEHHVFNLHRIMGAVSGDALARAVSFYKKFIPMDLLTLVPLEIAELSKPLENAYRYIEIAIAEEIKMMCEAKGISFDELRKAMNTKWNIDLKEARNGIGGKCLPKDCNFINDFFGGSTLFQAALFVDEDYRKMLKDRGIKTEDFREIK
jgi:nucleotide sugar dehydrogenase